MHIIFRVKITRSWSSDAYAYCVQQVYRFYFPQIALAAFKYSYEREFVKECELQKGYIVIM